MTDGVTCEQAREQALAARYVARRLSRDEAEAYESHYVACPRCQEEVRLAVAVRRELRVPPGTERHRRRVAWVWGGLGLAAAAGLAAILLLRLRSPSAELVGLGGVLEPPVYLGVQVRGPSVHADSLFGVAMAAYGEKRYRDAILGLRAALAAGVDSVPAEFFLGASLLVERRSSDAAEAFRRVIAGGETPYLVESRYYLAKSLLRQGRGREALEELRRLSSREGIVPAQGKALADSVEGVLRRR